MSRLGTLLRKFREEKNLPLRTVAAFLDIDQAILSKIERGVRKPSREQVTTLAGYFEVNENELLVAWLSDKVLYELENEEMALEALQAAEASVQYMTKSKQSKEKLISAIKSVLEKDGRVAAAYLFGSYARGEEKPGSDVDIMVEFNDLKKYSMFDLAEVAHLLENRLSKKVDLVEKGSLKNFAEGSASKDLITIYEKAR